MVQPEQMKEGRLKIVHVQAGSGAKDGDAVSVIYTGKLDNGTVFDTSSKHGGEPIEDVEPLVSGLRCRHDGRRSDIGKAESVVDS